MCCSVEGERDKICDNVPVIVVGFNIHEHLDKCPVRALYQTIELRVIWRGVPEMRRAQTEKFYNIGYKLAATVTAYHSRRSMSQDGGAQQGEIRGARWPKEERRISSCR